MMKKNSLRGDGVQWDFIENNYSFIEEPSFTGSKYVEMGTADDY